ncbi:hypothetical protein M0R45_027606 [Rubus argutus]|uniref:Uncharacterized protein n=1 Tax=Rubus argutus TaxID=59490 RepID=A0AAW1X0Y1_RUBAR
MKLQALILVPLIFFSTLLFLIDLTIQLSLHTPVTRPTHQPVPTHFANHPPHHQRVQDLVSRLTLDEKISQLVNSAPPISRLAASFNEHLWYRIGQVIGTEARAVYNAGQATGMTFWAPNINISGTQMGERAGDTWGRPIDDRKIRCVLEECDFLGLMLGLPSKI